MDYYTAVQMGDPRHTCEQKDDSQNVMLGERSIHNDSIVTKLKNRKDETCDKGKEKPKSD